MRNMTSAEIHSAIKLALDKVERQLASGEMDGSGRFYTDEELARGAATGGATRKADERFDKKTEAPAA